jgi:hypothetical protein
LTDELARSGVPVDRTSVYAEEGTAAHTLGEECLRTGSDAEAWLGYVVKGKQILQDDFDEGFPVTDEMADAVQVYLDVVRAEHRRLDHSELRIEERVSMAPTGRGDVWGTSDAIIIQHFGEISVYDFKYGRGVVVDVAYNEQQMCYALGALYKYGPGNFDRVNIGIVQPRAGGVKRWTTTPQELMDWGEVMKAAADATDDPKAPLNPGDWCRFCPAKGGCPSLRAKVSNELVLMFDSPEALAVDRRPRLPNAASPVEVSRALAILPLIDDWAKAVSQMAFGLMENGVAIPGYKLVRKSSNRKWSDEAAMIEALKERGVLPHRYLEPQSLRSPAQLEKVKEIGKDLVKEHAHKPQGGLTVVSEADEREAVALTSLIDTFSTIDTL